MTATLTVDDTSVSWPHLRSALTQLAGELGADVELPGEQPVGADPVSSALAQTSLRPRRVELAETADLLPRVPLVAADTGAATLFVPRPGGWTEHRWDATGHTVAPTTQRPAGAGWTVHRRLPAGDARGTGLLRFALRGRGVLLGTTVAASVLATAVTFAMPVGTLFLLAAILLDRHDLLRWGVLALSGALVVGGLLAWTRDEAVTRLQSGVQRDLEPAVWDRLLAQPLSFFRAQPMRRLVGHAGGIGQLRGLLGASGLEALLGALFSCLAVALLAIVDLRLGAVALGLLLAVAGAVGLLAWLQQRHDRDVYEGVDDVQATVYPALLAIDEVHVYGGERAVLDRWWRAFETQKRADDAGLRYADLSSGIVTATQPLMLAVLLPVAWVVGSGFTGLWAVALAATQLNLALARLTGVIQAVFSAGPIHARLEPILTGAPEVAATARPAHRLAGAVHLTGVAFTYPGTVEPVLRDVSLRVEPGEFVAVVGPSGSGKSTLLRLLLGLDRPDAGVVSLDGHDLAGLDVDSVRAQIGYVPQDGRVLRGEIRSVILGAAAGAADDELAWWAAGRAGLADDLSALPLGLATRLSDGDAALSGGQLQRLLIARALAKRPRLLLLDEATSALDAATQDTVADAVATLEGMTRIVVAHRLSTIRRADRVLRVDRGVVTESTSHPKEQ